MDWKVRLTLNTAVHFLPCKYYLRRLKWRLSRNPFPWTADVILRGISLITKIEKSGFKFKNSTALEIGPGWEPTLPVLMFLKGCDVIMLYDLHRLLNPITLRHCILTVQQSSDRIAERLNLPKREIEEKLHAIDFGDFSKALKHLHIEYHAPADASNTKLKDGCIDLVFSNTVLEHIPPSIIHRIFSEAYRILKPKGIMYHSIDNADHWAQKDKNITVVNFLKYEDCIWRFVGINPLDYQNRLRYNEYVSLVTKHGFAIENSDYAVDEHSLQFIKSHTICRKYRDFPVEELAKIDITILARK